MAAEEKPTRIPLTILHHWAEGDRLEDLMRDEHPVQVSSDHEYVYLELPDDESNYFAIRRDALLSAIERSEASVEEGD
jgi:hypothetical protein